jgi:hypothetical protein
MLTIVWGSRKYLRIHKWSLCKKKLFFPALISGCARLVVSRLQQACVPQCLARWQNKKGKAFPLQAWTGPESSRSLRLSRQSAYEGGMVVSPTHRPPLLSENISGTHFCSKLSWPKGHSAVRRTMLTFKNRASYI